MSTAIATAVERGSFVYANPPTIHWGPGCIVDRLDAEVRRLDASRVFLVTTRSVGSNESLMQPLREALGDRLVGTFDRIGQHAPVRSVAEAAEAARASQPDALISFGGGSPIDATKAVAFSLATGLDLSEPDALAKSRQTSLNGSRLLPHLAIPTTLSAAELSSSAGMSAEQTREKTGIGRPELVPNVVFFDAQPTLHTPLELWLSTGIRAVDHAIETLWEPGSHPYSDTLALEALRRLKRGLLATRADPSDLAARTECQLGAWFSFTMPIAAARGLSHTLSKRIGSRHGIPHGISSCLVLPHVMRYLAPRTAAAQAQIAEALGVETRGLSESEAADRAAHAVADLIAEMGLPNRLGAFGLSEADLEEAVRPVANAEHSAADLLSVLRAAL